jgi:hypothetical protein
MPPMPMALIFAFEFAAYGCIAALLYRALPKKIGYVYISLIGANTFRSSVFIVLPANSML